MNWRFTLVLIKMNYGQIGDQTGLFNTTNPVFYTSGNRFVRRTGTFDKVNHSLLIHKLRYYGIDGKTTRWIQNWLED